MENVYPQYLSNNNSIEKITQKDYYVIRKCFYNVSIETIIVYWLLSSILFIVLSSINTTLRVSAHEYLIPFT